MISCGKMKYILFLLALVVFMRTCRTVENIQENQDHRVTQLRNDSLKEISRDSVTTVLEDSLRISSTEVFRVTLVSPLPISMQLFLNQYFYID